MNDSFVLAECMKCKKEFLAYLSFGEFINRCPFCDSTHYLTDGDVLEVANKSKIGEINEEN